MIDYTKGRYIVKDMNERIVGRIDQDEFVRDGIRLLYRVDGDEFYSLDSVLIGFINDGTVCSPSGEPKFKLEAN